MLRGVFFSGLAALVVLVAFAPSAQASDWDGCLAPILESAYELVKFQEQEGPVFESRGCNVTRPNLEECMCATPTTCYIYGTAGDLF